MNLRHIKPIQGMTALFVVLFAVLALIAALNGHLWLAAITIAWGIVGAGLVYWEESVLAAEEDGANDPL